MDIEVKCSCGKKLIAREEEIGLKITCPYCKTKFLIKEPTEIEKATKQIKAELSSIKFYLLGILFAIVVITIITILYYRDYCKAKEKLRDLQQEISKPYRY